MSRIGLKPVLIEEGVKVAVNGKKVVVSGPLGELTLYTPDTVKVSISGETVVVERVNDAKQAKSDHGTIRALIANMVYGVKNGYSKEMELVGLGYRASMQGETLVMALGWNHPITVTPPPGVTFSVEDGTIVKVTGADKNLVGLWAAKIRSHRKPEPYKGKGIRYMDEVVRRKTSKSVKEE